MPIEFSDLVNIYPFPTGRRIFACRSVLHRARDRELEAISGPAEEALEHDRETLALESRWEAKTAGENPEEDLTYGELARAQDAGQNLIARLVIVILSEHGRPDIERDPLLDILLEPILEQNELIRGYRRRREPTPDVDPVTGEVLEESF